VRIALVGQPNSGKSTVFNAVAGYRSLTSNIPGTTMEYTYGQARVGGVVIDLVDLPGLYSLTPGNPVEASAREFLLSGNWDVIINVVDASQLARSLELTLELKDLEAPLVVCLNMMDEAARKGMAIDTAGLSAVLDVPVMGAIAARGQGIVEVLRAALALHRQPFRGASRILIYAPEAEGAVQRLASALTPRGSDAHSLAAVASGSQENRRSRYGERVPSAARDRARDAAACTASLHSIPAETRLFPTPRFWALQLLQGDPHGAAQLDPEAAVAVAEARGEITERLGQPADVAISSARHAACLNLFERIVHLTRPRADWREWIDRAVMHPVWGYGVLAMVFLALFRLIYGVGKFGESHVVGFFEGLIALLARHLDPQSLAFAALKGALLGTAGAFAIVLPYLLPFLIGLAVLEDVGYLARVGYLMDAAMHRLGLHGTATLPVLLGYGCSVPAVMATRILASRRDRFVAAFLGVLVPCSARMTVILALVGFYLGANYALGIYVLNLLVVMLAGHLLARIWPEISPGMLMEVPAYRIPAPRLVLLKTWWRLREFVVVAFPLLVAGSAVLGLIEFYGWQQLINAALSPLTAWLGLPRAVGLTLIFGVLRKELSLLMLMQALGTTNVVSVMTTAQILIFTLFVTFYLPCLATLASMLRELGWRLTTAAAGALLALAVIISLAARVVLQGLH
jgi:ferrous iron transport protein B